MSHLPWQTPLHVSQLVDLADQPTFLAPQRVVLLDQRQLEVIDAEYEVVRPRGRRLWPRMVAWASWLVATGFVLAQLPEWCADVLLIPVSALGYVAFELWAIAKE